MTRKIKLVSFAFFMLMMVLIFNRPVLAGDPNEVIDLDGLTNGKMYYIKNVASGKCLNVNYGTDANGTNVTQWSSDGSIEQKFRIVYYQFKNKNQPSAYRIYAMCSDKGANRVLDVLRTGGSASGSIQSGNNVDIWTTGDDECQLFQIKKNTNGTYRILLWKDSSLALTAVGTGNGSGAGNTSTSNGNIIISNYTGGQNQQWRFEALSPTPAYPYRMTKGIGNQKYYMGAGSTSFYVDIAAGVTSWSPTIEFLPANNNSSTAIDFYGVDDKFFENRGETYIPGWLGMTDWAVPVDDDTKNPTLSGWSYAMVRLNKDKLPSKHEIVVRGVIAHEVGHAFGLMHTLDKSSLMYPDIGITSQTTPTSNDRVGLTTKY